MKAVMGVGMIRSSKWTKQATCRGYNSCCTVVLLYCSLLHFKSVMSGYLSTWVDLLSNRVGLFLGERVLKNTPTPLFEQPLKFITCGRIFESLRCLWMGTAVYLYLTVQLHILISPSLAVAVGILTIPFVLLPSNYCHDYSPSFNLFWLILQLCSLSRSQTLICLCKFQVCIQVYQLNN